MFSRNVGTMTHTGAVIDSYRRAMIRRRLARETIWARAANARRWMAWCEDWTTATFADVEDWIAARDVGQGASRNLLTQLRAFYRWAMREGLADADPTMMVERVRVPQHLPRPAGEAEIVTVLAGAEPQTAAMIALMAGGGLRCCEVSRLDWRDVDLTGGLVRVLGKGDKERLVAIGDRVIEHVGRVGGGHRGAVFVGPSGRRLSPARVSQIVGRAFRDQGSPVTAHQLRHRFATHALQIEGSNLLMVKEALGHASIATTTIYTQVVESSVLAMSRAVGLP